MYQVKLLKNLPEKTTPGRLPSYTSAHVLYTLIYLENNKVGRKQLASELRLGEGTVRTLLRRLREESLIMVDRQGISLSIKGQRFLDNLRKTLSWSDFPYIEITVGDQNFLVLVRGAADWVRQGVEQRDQALIHGARGATTLVYRDGRWEMPGLGDEVEPLLSEYLDSFSPREKDVAVIGSSEDRFTARLGGLAAALDLAFHSLGVLD